MGGDDVRAPLEQKARHRGDDARSVGAADQQARRIALNVLLIPRVLSQFCCQRSSRSSPWTGLGTEHLARVVNVSTSYETGAGAGTEHAGFRRVRGAFLERRWTIRGRSSIKINALLATPHRRSIQRGATPEEDPEPVHSFRVVAALDALPPLRSATLILTFR